MYCYTQQNIGEKVVRMQNRRNLEYLRISSYLEWMQQIEVYAKEFEDQTNST